MDKVHFFAVFSMLDTSTHNLIPLIDNLNVDLYAANFAKKTSAKRHTIYDNLNCYFADCLHFGDTLYTL